MGKGGKLKCPKCGGAAMIDRDPCWEGSRVVCLACGHHRELAGDVPDYPIEDRPAVLLKLLDSLPSTCAGASVREVANVLEEATGRGVLLNEVRTVAARSSRWKLVKMKHYGARLALRDTPQEQEQLRFL